MVVEIVNKDGELVDAFECKDDFFYFKNDYKISFTRSASYSEYESTSKIVELMEQGYNLILNLNDCFSIKLNCMSDVIKTNYFICGKHYEHYIIHFNLKTRKHKDNIDYFCGYEYEKFLEKIKVFKHDI